MLNPNSKNDELNQNEENKNKVTEISAEDKQFMIYADIIANLIVNEILKNNEPFH